LLHFPPPQVLTPAVEFMSFFKKSFAVVFRSPRGLVRSKVTLLVVLLVLPIAALVPIAIQRSLRQTPPRDLFNQGLAAIDQQDFAAVRNFIQKLESAHPKTEFPDLLQSVFQLRTNAPQNALRTLLTLDLNGPLRHDILLYSGEALYRTGRLREARNALTMLVEEVPDSVDAHRWLASTWYDLGANIPAIHHLTEVTRLAPADYRPHWLMGVMYRDFENYPEAIKHLTAAWERNPPADVRDLIGVYLSRSLQADHQYEQALKFLKQCRQSPAVLVETARAEFSLTRTDSAEKILESCPVPEDELAGIDYFLLSGDVLEARGKQAEAADKYAAGTARFPFDEDLQYRLATTLKAIGQTDRSEAEMAVWKRKNDLKKRLVDLNKIASEQPDNAAVRRELAEVCTQMQRPQLAAMWAAAAEACEQPQPQETPSDAAPEQPKG
jgi:tetratricopeptide (TPR) repeat protein